MVLKRNLYQTWTHARRLSSVAGQRALFPVFSAGGARAKWGAAAGVVATTIGGLQWAYGSATNFFDNRFVTKSNKAANDIADFYGCEDFMQVKHLCWPVCVECACAMGFSYNVPRKVLRVRSVPPSCIGNSFLISSCALCVMLLSVREILLDQRVRLEPSVFAQNR